MGFRAPANRGRGLSAAWRRSMRSRRPAMAAHFCTSIGTPVSRSCIRVDRAYHGHQFISFLVVCFQPDSKLPPKLDRPSVSVRQKKMRKKNAEGVLHARCRNLGLAAVGYPKVDLVAATLARLVRSRAHLNAQRSALPRGAHFQLIPAAVAVHFILYCASSILLVFCFY